MRVKLLTCLDRPEAVLPAAKPFLFRYGYVTPLSGDYLGERQVVVV